MLHTLKDLKNGLVTSECLGPDKRLKLAEGLTEFPREIFSLAEFIEILDMSDNDLSELPEDFGRLKNLKILFLSNNKFEYIPDVIAQCPELDMIGFKGNKIEAISERALPIKTRWLILTDNKINKLPDVIGKLSRLQKLALAGNKLATLPDAMADCKSLELIRLSANNFSTMPEWLFDLPKLAWLAFSGNPCTSVYDSEKINLKSVDLSDLKLGPKLGQGASGVIYQGQWLDGVSDGQDVAVKLFKGAVTSDGYPGDELKCCLTAGDHKNVIKAVAQIPNPEQLGLVMELIPSSFFNLGLPPTLATCTRDTFPPEVSFSIDTILLLTLQMASALDSLHGNNVSHGDIYAHNIMINESAQVLFGDFGAATSYDLLPDKLIKRLRRIEIRALGNLLEDLLTCISINSTKAHPKRYKAILELKGLCQGSGHVSCDSFAKITNQISHIGTLD
jgi:hypothetical protein